jgi:hypothetical protein
MQNPYEFNGVPFVDFDKLGVSIGIYTFEGVTTEHPLGFVIDNTDVFEVIQGTPHNTPKIIDDTPVQHYTGTIKIHVKGDFGVISYNCYNHGYMGGIDRLVYEESCESPVIVPEFNFDYDTYVVTSDPQDVGEFQTGSVTLYGIDKANTSMHLVSKIFPPDDESFPFIEYGAAVSMNHRFLMVSSPWQWVTYEEPLGDGEFELIEIEAAGKVYVYDLSNRPEQEGVWTDNPTTITAEEPEDSMGFGTMLDSSDRYIAVATDTSEVYVYDITDNWNQQTRITEWANWNDKNVKSIGVSNEYLIVGITNDNETSGQLHLYKRDDDLGGAIVSVGGWSGKLPGVNGSFVGKTVAIDKDSNIVVAGWTNLQEDQDTLESINVSLWQATPTGLEYLETITKELGQDQTLDPYLHVQDAPVNVYGDVNVDIHGDTIVVGAPTANQKVRSKIAGKWEHIGEEAFGSLLRVYTKAPAGGWPGRPLVNGTWIEGLPTSPGEALPGRTAENWPNGPQIGKTVSITDTYIIYTVDDKLQIGSYTPPTDEKDWFNPMIGDELRVLLPVSINSDSDIN